MGRKKKNLLSKTILMRVKAGAFATRVRLMAENLPEFMTPEKNLILSEIEIMEGQINSLRRNEYLRQLVDRDVPLMWKMVRALKIQLEMADGDEKAKELLDALRTLLPRRMSIDKTIPTAVYVCSLAAPEEETSALMFAKLRELVADMEVTDALRAEETARICTIGRSIETRRRIIALVERAMAVAQGFAFREETQGEAREAIGMLVDMGKGLGKNMPRRKRKKNARSAQEKTATTPQNTGEKGDIETGNEKGEERCGWRGRETKTGDG